MFCRRYGNFFFPIHSISQCNVNVPVCMHSGFTIKCVYTINITVFAVISTMFFFFVSSRFALLLSRALVHCYCFQMELHSTQYFVIFPNNFNYMATPTFVYLFYMQFVLFFPFCCCCCFSFSVIHFYSDEFLLSFVYLFTLLLSI